MQIALHCANELEQSVKKVFLLPGNSSGRPARSTALQVADSAEEQHKRAAELQHAPLHRQLNANFTLNTVTPALMESNTTLVHLFDKATSNFQIHDVFTL